MSAWLYRVTRNRIIDRKRKQGTLGILVLSKILFGGLGGGGSSHSKSSHRSKTVRDKWAHLSPEERERMEAEYESRWCSPEEVKEQ